MKKKSKFIAFILSFIPGLSHAYVGARERALIFFSLFLGTICAVTGLCFLAGSDDFFIVLLFVLPLIWFIAMLDAMFLTDRRQGSEESGQNGERENGNDFSSIAKSNDNRKLLTIAFSFIPGAGHMYLGLQQQGLQFMSLFAFTAFLMGWLNMSLFLFALPVIWFYSLFDAYHRIEEDRKTDWDKGLPIFGFLRTHPQWVGWGMIALGCLIVLERIVSPFISYQLRNIFQTGLVAAVLIFFGIKLLRGEKMLEGKDSVEGKEEVEQCDSAE